MAIARARRDFNRRGNASETSPLNVLSFRYLYYTLLDTRPRGRSHLRIVPIGSDNTRTKCSKPDPALKLPPIFLSLPAERNWKIEAQKAFRSAAIHFCSFPRRTMLAHPLLVIHRAADSSRRNRLSRTLYSSDP